MNHDWIDAEITAAQRRGRRLAATEPRATSARYHARSGRVTVTLSNGCVFVFPARAVQGLGKASDAQLARIELSPLGVGLRWPLLDADVTVGGLLMGLFGTRAWMAREWARRAGATPSPAKADAARRNGRKGGRPRKPVQEALAQPVRRSGRQDGRPPGARAGRRA